MKFLGICKKVNDFLASPIPFYYLCICLAVYGWHWDAGYEMKVHGLAYHNKKDVCFTFSSVQLKRRKFQRVFRWRQRWASTHRVYLHYGIGVPFSFVWRGCNLCRTQYIYRFGVGFCCFLSLTWQVFRRTSTDKDYQVATWFLRLPFIIATNFHI